MSGGILQIENLTSQTACLGEAGHNDTVGSGYGAGQAEAEAKILFGLMNFGQRLMHAQTSSGRAASLGIANEPVGRLVVDRIAPLAIWESVRGELPLLAPNAYSEAADFLNDMLVAGFKNVPGWIAS